MSSEATTLSGCYGEAEVHRKKLESFLDSNSSTFQDNLSSAIAKYQQCLSIASQVSLFSPNESLEDVSSRDLRYFLIHYHIAELLFRRNRPERKELLLEARSELEQYLSLLDQYDVLSKADVRLVEQYNENKAAFSTASTVDVAKRREVKIQRFREEKTLKQKLEVLQQNPRLLETSDETLRELSLTQIAFCAHQTFQNLESIAQELKIISLAPSTGPLDQPPFGTDSRSPDRAQNGQSDRLDGSLSQLLANGKAGPILNKDGRPIRPFTLLDSRQRLQNGVFRPDHNLPTMTIDEYLEEEKKRGGIIEGGGEASMQREYVDEDDLDKTDEATMKARAWDDFKEANPRGSGNTMNMG